MKKKLSLIKVCLRQDMNIFKINKRKQSKLTKFLVPTILAIYIMGLIGVYANELLKFLKPMHLEYIVLSFFAFVITILSLIEGIYKVSSMLFNCRDDDLLLSLPISRKTVLFIRILKFYVFELLYNSLFLLPVIVVYALNVLPSWTYYLASVAALLVLPIVPIMLSCLIGFITSSLSSKFKGKNLLQTIFTVIFVLLVMFIYLRMQNFISDFLEKAINLHNIITSYYYPIRFYISLVNNFHFMDFLIFFLSHLLLLTLTIFLLGKVYFRINSSYKRVLTLHKNNQYTIKSSSKIKSFVKKELNKFISTPVFLMNAGFGLILFIVICVMISLKYDSIINSIINSNSEITMELVEKSFPVLMFAFICFSSFMTSITSSMISLEGSSLNILKSLPVKSFKIILYKIVAALTIMIPCFVIGDIIIFIRFKFDIIISLLILLASILLPFISELIGIMINLKYPKMDALNDTEVVKQSMSSMIATFIGMGLSATTIVLLFIMLSTGMNNLLIMSIFLLVFMSIGLALWLLLVKTSDKSFNNINV